MFSPENFIKVSRSIGRVVTNKKGLRTEVVTIFKICTTLFLVLGCHGTNPFSYGEESLLSPWSYNVSP